ncbi:MAG: VF530 family protein [Burkholderiaceae bacterium]|nr:VF530 family protein [Burkholderiaceae bacterium]
MNLPASSAPLPAPASTASTTSPVAPAAPAAEATAPRPAPQARNPLHGVTLEAMVVALSGHFGWERLARHIAIRCFQSDPSVASSLKFLRKTPWAREKVESLYLFMLREQRRSGRG